MPRIITSLVLLGVAGILPLAGVGDSQATPGMAPRIAFAAPNDSLASPTAGASTALTGWTAAPPGGTAITALPAYRNDSGCAGYYRGDSNNEFYCKASRIDIEGTKVVIRRGFWNGTRGYGWKKAVDYHNLWIQPIIDVIFFATPRPQQRHERVYTVYHYTLGYLDQEVVVVSDNIDASYGGVPTPDGKPIGLITAYCRNEPSNKIEPCPDWVDQTL
jgi:hypothetical protein